MLEYQSIKPLLFKLQPETAHHLISAFLQIANYLPSLFNPWVSKNFIEDEALEQELFGRKFYNPVGLAAGMDKDASMIPGMMALGYGFTEVGTLTVKPQSGNPKPRLWRHVQEEALQNAMGFNNRGMAQAQKRLKKRFPYVTPIGVNIGKNKNTPEDQALNDYTTLIKGLHHLADYMVINISSPNTPGLRDLQNESFIKALFKVATDLTEKPILLKIAPDMEPAQAVDLTSLAVESGAQGIIATNTTIDHTLVSQPYDIGGISGQVLQEKSFEIFEAVAKALYGKTTLISVGGIDSAQEAYRRIKAGANLVQLFSPLIFKGPTLIKEINLGLLDLMQKENITHISQAIGMDRR